MILESTKVIVESLPKESIWSSSLFTSIIGSIVGGIAAFIGIIWQMKKQRNLEIKKIEIELKLKELDKYSEVVEKLYYDISDIITDMLHRENIYVAKKENHELTELLNILKEDHEYMELQKKITKNNQKITNNILYISEAFNNFFEPLYTEFTKIIAEEQYDSHTFTKYSEQCKYYLIKKIPNERQKLIKSIYETKKELGK